MANHIRLSLFLALLLMVTASVAQETTQSPAARPRMGKAIGRLVVDGTPSQTTTTIYVSSEVVTDTTTHLNVINAGNTLVFTPNSSFRAMRNGFKLNSGGSKVASYTGMTAHLPNCYSVTPVNPAYMTLYEVNWSGSAALVYARSEDVRINYWAGGEPNDEGNPKQADRGWVVRQGQTARIPDVKLCRPVIDFWPQPINPTAIELGVTTAVVVSIPFWPTKHDMSPDHP